MLAKSQSRSERRGIVLVLVLAMLGLLALVGVTFATFSGQERINARNFAQSLIQPQDDELMDFALSQLINDTGDPRSVLRGHSMARDMYGTGSTSNGFLTVNPGTGSPLYITSITAPVAPSSLYTLTIGSLVNGVPTNILENDPNFFGFSFTRWIMRVSYAGPVVVNGSSVNIAGTGTVTQTFEIISDSGFNPSLATARTFSVYISSTDAGGPSFANTLETGEATALNNPTVAPNFPTGFLTRPPGAYLVSTIANATNTALGKNFPFQLDGRWLHAFNGPGMGANAVYGNFRFNGALLDGTAAAGNATSNFPGNPNIWAMDEDYDACDLENWFLAIQSADGQVMIPSFHRPAIIRNDTLVNTPPTINDWRNINPASGTNPVFAFADSASRILRPRKFDGNNSISFPDLVPNPTTGQITYDVDNDGDGVTDSVWLDLGYPVRRDSRGQLYKPLFAFMVIGLNGRIPLNTAGNLAGTVAGMSVPPGASPANPTVSSGAGHSLHLGNSTSEIDPMYALQNGYNFDLDRDC